MNPTPDHEDQGPLESLADDALTLEIRRLWEVLDPPPGDLVIFPNFHVGIYAGNGQMIDAPTEGRMVELGGLDAGGSYYFVRL